MNSTGGRKAVLCLTILLSTVVARTQARNIDPDKSTMTVHVSKAGVFAAAGHDHEITAPIADGKVNTNPPQVELRVNAKAMKVRDPNASEDDRAKVQKTMSGPEVLDVERYPEIVFECGRAEPAGERSWKLTGSLTLHGEKRPVSVSVHEKDGHYVGTSVFKQSEFGIKPIKVAGGTIRVKDEVRIEFDIQLTR